jgi:hypothetical protein
VHVKAAFFGFTEAALAQLGFSWKIRKFLNSVRNTTLLGTLVRTIF